MDPNFFKFVLVRTKLISYKSNWRSIMDKVFFLRSIVDDVTDSFDYDNVG